MENKKNLAGFFSACRKIQLSGIVLGILFYAFCGIYFVFYGVKILLCADNDVISKQIVPLAVNFPAAALCFLAVIQGVKYFLDTLKPKLKGDQK
jgi:hypothetical protein